MIGVFLMAKASKKGVKKVENYVTETFEDVNNNIEDIVDYADNYQEAKKNALNYDNWQNVEGTLKGPNKEGKYTWKQIMITGLNDGEIDGETLGNVLIEFKAVISNLETDAGGLDNIANAIGKAEKEINKHISSDVRNKALLVLFDDGMASNEYDAKHRDFIDPKNIHYPNGGDWDGEIEFERQSNGTYLIYKKDKNGNKIPMGYTTAQGKRKYYNEIAKNTKNRSRVGLTGDKCKQLDEEAEEAGVDSNRFEKQSDGTYIGKKTHKRYTEEEAKKKCETSTPNNNNNNNKVEDSDNKANNMSNNDKGGDNDKATKTSSGNSENILGNTKEWTDKNGHKHMSSDLGDFEYWTDEDNKTYRKIKLSNGTIYESVEYKDENENLHEFRTETKDGKTTHSQYINGELVTLQ